MDRTNRNRQTGHGPQQIERSRERRREVAALDLAIVLGDRVYRRGQSVLQVAQFHGVHPAEVRLGARLCQAEDLGLLATPEPCTLSRAKSRLANPPAWYVRRLRALARSKDQQGDLHRRLSTLTSDQQTKAKGSTPTAALRIAS